MTLKLPYVHAQCLYSFIATPHIAPSAAIFYHQPIFGHYPPPPFPNITPNMLILRNDVIKEDNPLRLSIAGA